MKKFLTALLLAPLLAFGLASPAQAAPSLTGKPGSSATGPTITLDPGTTGLELAPTATDLSKNTGVKVVVGSCEGGLYCVEFGKDECSNPAAAGCAWAWTDTTGVAACRISIEEYGWDRWLTVYVTTHEVVHCLTWIGGAGMFHVDDRDSILNSTAGRQMMRENETRINNADRVMIREIYATLSA